MGKKKVDKTKTWLLIKNPQFCSNQANILATNSAHEMIILTKFHKDRTKIVDFLLIAKFWACLLFLLTLYYDALCSYVQTFFLYQVIFANQ